MLAQVEDVGSFDRSYEGARPYATTFFEESQGDGSTNATVTNAFGVDSNEMLAILRARAEAERERRGHYETETDGRAFKEVSWRDMLEAWDEFQGGDGAALREVDDRLTAEAGEAVDEDGTAEAEGRSAGEDVHGVVEEEVFVDEDVAATLMEGETQATKREKKRRKKVQEEKAVR